MTTFGDQVFEFGGVPVNGSLPLMVGGPTYKPNYYFVDGANGADGNSGLKPNESLATVGEAITRARARVNWSNTPWARRDVIVIAPGVYDENLTSLAHGCVFVGLGWDTRDGQMGVKIKPTAGSAVQVGGVVNSSFINIGFETGGGTNTYYAFDGGAVNNCYFENCFFSGPAESATIAAAFYSNQCVKSTFKNCWFCNALYGVRFEYEASGDSISYLDMSGCLVSGVTTAGIYTSANLVGPHSIVRNTDIFGGGQTITKGIDDNSGILTVSWCNIEATTAVEGCRAVNGSYGNGTLLT